MEWTKITIAGIVIGAYWIGAAYYVFVHHRETAGPHAWRVPLTMTVLGISSMVSFVLARYRFHGAWADGHPGLGRAAPWMICGGVCGIAALWLLRRVAGQVTSRCDVGALAKGE